MEHHHLTGRKDSADQIRQEIMQLEARLVDVQARFPAHSLPPALLAEMDELDEQLDELRRRLGELEHRSGEDTS